MQKRDQRDKERSVAPLVAAKDAHLIDTTKINKEETLEIASSLIIKKFEITHSLIILDKSSKEKI